MVVRCKKLVVKGGVAEPLRERAAHGRRCFRCSKKLSVAAGMTCRCGKVYCSAHRYAEDHDCTFDFRSLRFHHLAREVEFDKREWVGGRGR